MTETANVSIEDVLRVGELANLDLDADEARGMQRDLNAILGHVAQLNELDTSEVEPMAQVAQALGGQVEASAAALRLDAVRPSLQRLAVMSAAPETDGSFFKVPKVIDR